MAVIKSKTKDKKVYVEAVGRRKTAVARVRLFPAGRSKSVNVLTVNQTALDQYFPIREWRETASGPLTTLVPAPAVRAEIKVKGGGLSAQAAAIAHGLARALVKADPDRRPILKKARWLRRDPRMKERRKFGLKKARKAPQWSKR